MSAERLPACSAERGPARPVERLAARLGARLGAPARLAALAACPVVLLSAVTGLLYWARLDLVGIPGPTIAALPLDELAGHDRVPLALFVVVVGFAAVLAGLTAGRLRIGRLPAAAVLGVAGGAWTFVHQAAAYFVVQQVPLPVALDEARPATPIYLAAALMALGGALLGEARPQGRTTARLAAAGVALAGALDVLIALFGRPPRDLAAGPSVLLPLSRAIDLPVGLLLVLSARALIRRNHSAWRIAVTLLVLSSLAHLALSPAGHRSATLSAALAALLVAGRDGYPASGDPLARSRVAARAVAVVLGAVAVSLAGVLIANHVHGASPSPSAALDEALRALAGRRLQAAALAGSGFAHWFPWLVAATLALGVGWAGVPLLAPWRPRFQPSWREGGRAHRLVRQHGRDSLAPFALRPDKALFFAPAGLPAEDQAVIAYRVVRNVALAGMPIGRAWSRPAALTEFREWAHGRGWSVAVLGAGEDDLASLREHGFLPVYHGVEGVIDTERFNLDGGRMKAVRQAVGRLQRNGFSAAVLYAGELTPDLRREIAEVEHAALAGARRTGFAMELDDLFRLGSDDAVFALGRDDSGRLSGLIHFAACPASRTLSLSSMPRLDGMPNGFNSWLVVEAVSWARAHGFRFVSLNFAPLAEPAGARASVRRRRIRRRLLASLRAVLPLQLDNLHAFNRQFCADFRPRYVVVERLTDLPRVVVAAMAAEGYLPFAERVRGWSAPAPAEPGEREPATT